MKKELQDKLFKKYPAIFRQKDLDKTQTAMCWGIACGDGWYDLIDDLCSNIQTRVKDVNRQRIYRLENSPKTIVPTKVLTFTCEAVQVKEKFGRLRFYAVGSDDYIDGLISMTETISARTCSVCGERVVPDKENRGWIYTLCNGCKEKK